MLPCQAFHVVIYWNHNKVVIICSEAKGISAMTLEVEVKFYCSDFQGIRRSLRDLGAFFLHASFESNLVFDTPDYRLRKESMLLRLRSTGSQGGILCLKRPPSDAQPDDVKAWEELETPVDRSDEMRRLFLALGYILSFSYEKMREEWELAGCRVCLDILPFGRFVEIEGERQAIFDLAERLGIAECSRTVKNYHELNREYRARNNLAPDDSFVFSEPDKSRLIESCSGIC